MNYDQLMGFIAGLVIMFLLVSVIFTLNHIKNILFHNPEPKKQAEPENIAKPDIIVVAKLYEDGTATIKAKDCMGTPYPTSMQEYATHLTLNALNFFLAPSTPEPEIEAVREASTMLEGVAVDVEREKVLDELLPPQNQFENIVKVINKRKEEK